MPAVSLSCRVCATEHPLVANGSCSQCFGPLDPTYAWLEPRLGYSRAFHPGPKADPAAISRAGASPSSLRAFAFTATPVTPGVSGGRAFCGDSTGRMCMTKNGSPPPVKDGRCEPCQKIQ